MDEDKKETWSSANYHNADDPTTSTPNTKIGQPVFNYKPAFSFKLGESESEMDSSGSECVDSSGRKCVCRLHDDKLSRMNSDIVKKTLSLLSESDSDKDVMFVDCGDCGKCSTCGLLEITSGVESMVVSDEEKQNFDIDQAFCNLCGDRDCEVCTILREHFYEGVIPNDESFNSWDDYQSMDRDETTYKLWTPLLIYLTNLDKMYSSQEIVKIKAMLPSERELGCCTLEFDPTIHS